MSSKTNKCREQLKETFGYDKWNGPGGMTEDIKEAREAFEITMSWQCIATGRKRDGKACIFEKATEQDDTVDASYVSEKNTWIRFKGCPTIFKYLNSLEMQERIREFDDDGHTDMEEGDKFTLEPLARMSARSSEYQKKRRALIAAGLHVPKPRGPNVNRGTRTVVHHFRPY
jgi:hypothetical protein